MKIESMKPIPSVQSIQPLHTNPYQVKSLMDDSVQFTDLIKTNETADEEEVTKKLNRIRAKLKAGKRLTGLEKSFLLKHAPDLYRVAQRVELQRNALKAQLEHVKSKEEANDAISAAIGMISDKDPDAAYLKAGLHDEAKQFQESEAYKGLPATRREAKKGAVYHPYESGEDDRKRQETTGIYGRKGEFVTQR